MQVTQQLAQKLNSNQKVEKLDYNVVTGDTPTIYAGNANSEHDDEQPSSGGLFNLPSLPTILETIGSISNLKLPNIGLNMNWANLPVGRLDSGLASKLGTLDTDVQGKNRGVEDRPPVWVEGPNGPMLNPYYVETNEDPIPSLENPETIYPVDYIAHVVKSTTPSNEEARSASSILFPGNSVKKRGPNPDTFRFPDEPPRLDARGPNNGFIFPGSQMVRPQNSIGNKEPNPHRHHPLPSVIHVGPGQNAGTPFLPGLPRNQQTVRPGLSHIIGIRPGVSTVSKIPMHNQHSFTKKHHHNVKQTQNKWSSPEVINPLSGVSLYQPSEQFKPYHPPNDNNPIQIIAPPRKHSQDIVNLALPHLHLHPTNIHRDSIKNDTNTVALPLDNADVIGYSNPTDVLQQDKGYAPDTPPIAPELEQDVNDENIKVTITSSPPTTTNKNPLLVYPDYDLEIPGPYTATQSIFTPGYIETTTISVNGPASEHINTLPSEAPQEDLITNTSATFPSKINDDDSHSIDDILDLLFAAEKEVAQEDMNYDTFEYPVNNEGEQTNDTQTNVASNHTLQKSDLLLFNFPVEKYNHELPVSDEPPLVTTLKSIFSPISSLDYELNQDINRFNLGQDNLFLVPDSSTTTEINIPPQSEFPPFKVTTAPTVTINATSTLSSVELAQFPPGIHENINKFPSKVSLSESQGNIEDYGPLNLGVGVSVLQGKPSPDKIVELQYENKDEDEATNIADQHLISPDLDEYETESKPKENLLKELIALAGDSYYRKFAKNEPPANVRTAEPYTINSQGQLPLYHNSHHLFPNNRYGNQPNNLVPPQGDNFNGGGFGVPTISRVRPASISVVNIDLEEEKPPSNLLPPLTPALTPPRESVEDPALVYDHYLQNQHKQKKEEGYDDKGLKNEVQPSPRFGTLHPESEEGPKIPSNNRGIDWYYNNYFRDYGNSSTIPTGGSKLHKQSSSSRATEMNESLFVVHGTLLLLYIQNIINKYAIT